jgi:hypothetical protein
LGRHPENAEILEVERAAFKRAHGFRNTREAAFAQQMRSGGFLNSIQRDMLWSVYFEW